ncbi:DNA glycosylase AlkZ-like family protein [Paenibacillus terrae]|uniref:Winged helix-turn-helix domain-containing protein n=1 Tax=Paenibacillus terrae TaxID=159743 RepID=A0A0D7X895_9BACL|nr:crosslink repair DNA glycosylase YcaQ family protein [Paenibacillus terrae]KJD46252.1 hypothetical protein QD47_07805 [Paenibacillus terrae]
MEEIQVSQEEMRAYLLAYQGLTSLKPLADEVVIVDFIKKVGCIQYDPLNMVGRNPDLMLQSRFTNYDPVILEHLLYGKQKLIDGWDKMMSIYSVEDWPFFQRLRASKVREMEGILAYRQSLEAIQYVDEVKAFIESHGPASPLKLDLGNAKNGRWGHGKLSSAAMDYMWNAGTLSVKEKKNTQKIYDLTEKLLPKEILDQIDPFENDHDFYKWYFKRRIGGIGAYWDRNGGGWLGHFVSDKPLRTKILHELFEEGELSKVKVAGIKETFYMKTEDVTFYNHMKSDFNKTVHFLAPLDNLLWDRKLIKDLFHFEYSWEVYRPVSMRKYGYYVLPVLYGNQLVARFEPDMHRGTEPLRIKNWWWEEGYEVTDAVVESVREALQAFCSYLKADGLSQDSSLKIIQ